MSTQTEWNQSYYGHPFAARQLVMQMEGTNPGADPLRDVLTRYGSSNAQAQVPAQPQGQQQPGYAPPYPQYQSPQGGAAAGSQAGLRPTQLQSPPGGRGPIQQQNLTAPNR